MEPTSHLRTLHHPSSNGTDDRPSHRQEPAEWVHPPVKLNLVHGTRPLPQPVTNQPRPFFAAASQGTKSMTIMAIHRLPVPCIARFPAVETSPDPEGFVRSLPWGQRPVCTL